MPHNISVPDIAFLYDIHRRINSNATAYDCATVGVGGRKIVCAWHAICYLQVVWLHTGTNLVRQSYRFVMSVMEIIVRWSWRSLFNLRYRKVSIQIHRIMHWHQSCRSINLFCGLVARSQSKALGQARSLITQRGCGWINCQFRQVVWWQGQSTRWKRNHPSGSWKRLQSKSFSFNKTFEEWLEITSGAARVQVSLTSLAWNEFISKLN